MHSDTIVNSLRHVGFDGPQSQQLVDIMDHVATQAVSPIVADLKAAIADMRADIHKESMTHLRWIVGTFLGTIIAMTGLLLTAYRVFH